MIMQSRSLGALELPGTAKHVMAMHANMNMSACVLFVTVIFSAVVTGVIAGIVLFSINLYLI